MTSPLTAFIEAACVPRDQSHSTGKLERAQAILAANPELAGADIHAAAILGDDPGVRRFLALDPGNATAKGGPYGWDALTYLCFSRYLRLEPARSDGFVRAATALLDAGASANTGFWEASHQPEPDAQDDHATRLANAAVTMSDSPQVRLQAALLRARVLLKGH